MTLVDIALGAALVVASAARAEAPPPPAATPPASGQHAGHAATAACADARVACGLTASPAFDSKGRLWVAFSVGKSVYAAVSGDNGKSFEPPVTIATTQDGVIDANGDARPKITALTDGGLIASYTTRPDKQMIGTVFTARSHDGGKTFAAPQAMLNEGGQRFESFVVDRKGKIYAAWLDKTHLLQAKAAGQPFLGSGVAFAVSTDGGATFKGKSILIDHACECCRTSAALDKDGGAVFAWRQVLDGNIRDHYVAKLSADATTIRATRVSTDDWAVNSCPHHGPSLAIDSAGVWHIVWFTKSDKRQGLFYARSVDGGKSFSEPEKIGDDARAPSHPAALAVKGRAYRVWKEFDGTATTIVGQTSRDAGKNWSAPRVLAHTGDASDHPELIAQKGGAYLSWLTKQDGYRLIPLPRDEKSAAR